MTLNATPSLGSTFSGWSGATCSGNGACVFNVSAPVSVTATFATAAACTYALNPADATAMSAGGNATFIVTPSAASCTWSATGNASWLSIVSGGTGTGPGSVTYSVLANATSATRSGTISVADRIFTVTQAGASGSYRRYFAEGATGSFFDTSIALLNPGAPRPASSCASSPKTGRRSTALLPFRHALAHRSGVAGRPRARHVLDRDRIGSCRSSSIAP